jgi:hypothetical protein
MNRNYIEKQLAAAFAKPQKYKLDEDCCILTAADSNVFAGFQFLYHSLDLSHEFVMQVFDLGLTAEQREWIEALPNVRIRNLEEAGTLLMGKTYEMWQTWNKPLYFKACGYERILWLDTDCVVHQDLRPLFERLMEMPVLVKDPAPPDVWKNYEPLYQKKPVKQRLRTAWANGGIVAIKKTRDDEFMDEWIRCIQEVSTDKVLMSHVRYFDQGCMNWAIERLGMRDKIWHDHRYCVVPGNNVNVGDPDVFIHEKLLIEQTAIIAHYYGINKPWAHYKSKSITGPLIPGVSPRITPAPLKVFVLWHDSSRIWRYPWRWYHQYINLSELPIGEFKCEAIAESRAYLADLPIAPEDEYIGMASARWNEKYRHEVTRLENLHHLNLSPNVVWAADRTPHGWAYNSDYHHPGMYPLLEEMARITGLQLTNNPTLYGNNFVCHRSVFEDLVVHIRKVISYFHKKYHFDIPFNNGHFDRVRQAAYFYERATMLYFANRSDLIIKSAEMRQLKVF